MLAMQPLSERKMEPALVEKCLAFCQTVDNSKYQVSIQAFCGHGWFPIKQGAVQKFNKGLKVYW